MLGDSQPIDSLKPGLRGNINSFLRKNNSCYPLQGIEPPPPRGRNPVGSQGGGYRASFMEHQSMCNYCKKTPRILSYISDAHDVYLPRHLTSNIYYLSAGNM